MISPTYLQQLCHALIAEAGIHTRELYDLFDKDTKLTPKENYRYWMGYKAALYRILQSLDKISVHDKKATR